jgi:hypothetical protein
MLVRHGDDADVFYTVIGKNVVFNFIDADFFTAAYLRYSQFPAILV